jgi:hypothetical protein
MYSRRYHGEIRKGWLTFCAVLHGDETEKGIDPWQRGLECGQHYDFTARGRLVHRCTHP